MSNEVTVIIVIIFVGSRDCLNLFEMNVISPPRDNRR